jgi:hypothetical protein
LRRFWERAAAFDPAALPPALRAPLQYALALSARTFGRVPPLTLGPPVRRHRRSPGGATLPPHADRRPVLPVIQPILNLPGRNVANELGQGDRIAGAGEGEGLCCSAGRPVEAAKIMSGASAGICFRMRCIFIKLSARRV